MKCLQISPLYEAWQWDGKACAPDRPDWVNECVARVDHNEGILYINTEFRDSVPAKTGDWIIKNPTSRPNVCVKFLFTKIFVPVEEPTKTPRRRPAKYRGYTIAEAVAKATDVGTLGAWEWLQAWYKAELDRNSPPPEDW